VSGCVGIHHMKQCEVYLTLLRMAHNATPGMSTAVRWVTVDGWRWLAAPSCRLLCDRTSAWRWDSTARMPSRPCSIASPAIGAGGWTFKSSCTDWGRKALAMRGLSPCPADCYTARTDRESTRLPARRLRHRLIHQLPQLLVPEARHGLAVHEELGRCLHAERLHIGRVLRKALRDLG